MTQQYTQIPHMITHLPCVGLASCPLKKTYNFCWFNVGPENRLKTAQKLTIHKAPPHITLYTPPSPLKPEEYIRVVYSNLIGYHTSDIRLLWTTITQP